MSKKFLGSILFLYAAFIVSNLFGFKIQRTLHSESTILDQVAEYEESKAHFSGRTVAGNPTGSSTLTEAQVDLLQNNFKNLKATDVSKENQKDLKALVRSVLDERPIKVEFKKEEPSDWFLLYTGIMQSGPVAFIIFILGLFFTRPQPLKNHKVHEIKSDTRTIKLGVFHQTRRWDDTLQEWTVHRRINFGFMKFEKTYHEKPAKAKAA